MQTQAPRAPKQDFSDTIHKVDKDEKLLAIIKRHPFGIVKLYVQVFLGLGVAVGLLYYLLPEFVNSEDNPQVYSLIGLGVVLVVAIMLVITLVATVIYYQSKLVLTDKTLTQTIQTSLFSNKTSQLAISSVEDVTAHKSGFFPTILNYGRLLVETAGEQENFHFDYCPHSEHYAKLILEARQQFMGAREAELREEQHSYAYAAQPSAQTQYQQQQQPMAPPPMPMPGQQPTYAPSAPAQPQAQPQFQPGTYQPPAQPTSIDPTTGQPV